MREHRLRLGLALAAFALPIAALIAFFIQRAMDAEMRNADQPSSAPVPTATALNADKPSTAADPSAMGENAHRILGGMTANEVNAILGGPPANYSTRRTYTTRSPSEPPRFGHVDYWLTNDREIMVIFNARERVVGVESYVAVPADEASPRPPPLEPCWSNRFRDD
jgi:hypothetical protein